MRLTLKGSNFLDSAERTSLAKFLSCTIEGDSSPEVPYKPNSGDDMYWTLDLGNNWKVKFDREHANQFEIIHRYQSQTNQFEQALAAWLAFRLSAFPTIPPDTALATQVDDPVTRRAITEKADAFHQFSRNGRWGTCSCCPRDTHGNVYPEFCANTGRYDHQLNALELAESWETCLR